MHAQESECAQGHTAAHGTCRTSASDSAPVMHGMLAAAAAEAAQAGNSAGLTVLCSQGSPVPVQAPRPRDMKYLGSECQLTNTLPRMTRPSVTERGLGMAQG